MGYTIPNLDAASTLDGTEMVEVFQGASPSKRTTTQAIADLAGGGGGGVALESYINSAMSAAVQAYVFRDEDDNIFRVYEPIRNNDVSRSQFAYADSIDLFRFDNVDCFSNTIVDVKLISLAADFIFQDCSLKAIAIKANGCVGNRLLITTWIGGGYGVSTQNGGEIYFTGDNAYMERTLVHGKFSSVDSIGENSYVTALTMLMDTNTIFFNNCKNSSLSAVFIWENGSQIRCSTDGFNLYDVHMGGAAKLYLGACDDTGNIVMGDFSQLGTNTNRYHQINYVNIGIKSLIAPNANDTLTLSYIEAGIHSAVTTTTNKANTEYKNLGGTTYELGVDTGAVTATAV